MNATQYIWKNGQLMNWNDAQTHVLTHALHYGSGVFEGIRFYSTEHGIAIFKLREHIERLFYSARQLEMILPYSEKEISDATIDIVKKSGLTSGYIRPIAYFGYGSMKVVPTNELPVDVVIAAWAWGDYLPVKAVDVAVSSFIRIHPKSSITDAKICGHYVNSILAGLAIRNTHYHEALLLDAEGYVAEGSAENVFIVKNGTICTTPKGTILVGITRNIVFDMARELNIPIEEKRFTVEDVLNSDEAFFSGTAVEITAIRSLNDQLIGDGYIGNVTRQIQTRFAEVVQGEVPAYHSSLTWVK